MSLPPLRQPKHFQYKPLEHSKQKEVSKTPVDYVIVTLKSDSKLVVASDAYHGILMVGGMFKCVVCDVSMENMNIKDLHKLSPQHKKKLMECPHLEDFSIHLLRQVNPDNYYCTICNVVVSKYITVRHVSTEAHKEELNKAKNRAAFYKSVD
ncbi:uncharacterized protein LOC125489189 [Plutella xylostella]|uniref:uncharacterized protein LOC125489189 n=1 Tax=Plutella xylostella TaxID=51655 RepID=UPI0020324F62|nr:uncharacterized protein LOC125489189 [Plutella xylostella]